MTRNSPTFNRRQILTSMAALGVAAKLGPGRALAAPGAAVSVRPQGPSWSGWSSQVLRTRRAGSSRI